MAERAADSKTVLAYVNPGVLFARRFTHRTWQSGAGAAGLFAGAAVFAAPVLPPSVPVAFRLAIGAVLAAAGMYGVFLVAAGRSHVVRITEDGIEKGQRFRPWAEIRSIGGCSQGGRVVLECFVGSQLMPWNWLLPTTPSLTHDEFRTLIRELDEFLSRAYPHVRVERTPRESD